MTVEVTEENFAIEFNEEQNFVEIRYQGVNASLLATLQQQILDLQAALTAAIGAVNGGLGTLQNSIDSLNAITVAQGNAIVDEAAIRLSTDTELGGDLTSTASDLGDAIEAETEARGAAILAEAEARNAAIATANAIIITDVAALALTVTGLATDMGAAQASIIEVSEALSTETAARAAQYSALQADFGDTNAAVLEESVARADADEALAFQITSIEADFTEEINAAVTTEALARASADEALGTLITVVQANVDGVSASVITEQTARVAADGTLNARYGVKVDANGHVAGFGLNITANNDTSFSEFVINADAFKVFNGTSDVSPFFVTGGIVYMTNVKVGSLDALTSSMGSLTIDDSLVFSSTGILRGGKTSFLDPTNGFWLGYDGGAYKFTFGNSTNGISWDGTNLEVKGKIIAPENIEENAISTYATYYVHNDAGWLTPELGLSVYSDLLAAARVTLDLGSETNAKKLLFDFSIRMVRTGGTNDRVRYRIVDETGGGSTVIGYSDAVTVSGDTTDRRIIINGTSTATGSRTYRIEVSEYVTTTGTPRNYTITWLAWCFKK